MTETTMPLIELLRKHDEGDFLRAVSEAVLQLLMEHDVEGLIGAGRHERADGRLTYRNGYRDRELKTRLVEPSRAQAAAGLLLSRLPGAATDVGEGAGGRDPGGLDQRRLDPARRRPRAGHGPVGDLQEHGVEALPPFGECKPSPVGQGEIDDRVGEFLDRPLAGEWPYVWLDATDLKVRQGGRIVSVAAIIAVAVNTDGRREIIGLAIGPSEAETFWTEFLRSLKSRGLSGVKLVISDAHTGLKAAIARVFDATWQRCRVHFMRNALAHASKAQHTVVAAAIRQAFNQPDRASAGETWRHVADQLRTRWPKLATLMDESEADVLAYMTFPAQHRTKLHSTNPLERSNKEVKRRADVVRIFPNEASITRLIGTILYEQNDEWQTQHRYMQLEAMAQIDAALDPILKLQSAA